MKAILTSMKKLQPETKTGQTDPLHDVPPQAANTPPPTLPPPPPAPPQVLTDSWGGGCRIRTSCTPPPGVFAGPSSFFI